MENLENYTSTHVVWASSSVDEFVKNRRGSAGNFEKDQFAEKRIIELHQN